MAHRLQELGIIGCQQCGEVTVAHDDGEDAVQVVHNTRCEDAHQAHLGGLEQRLLQAGVARLQLVEVSLEAEGTLQADHQILAMHRLGQEVGSAQLEGLAFQRLVLHPVRMMV